MKKSRVGQVRNTQFKLVTSCAPSIGAVLFFCAPMSTRFRTTTASDRWWAKNGRNRRKRRRRRRKRRRRWRRRRRRRSRTRRRRRMRRRRRRRKEKANQPRNKRTHTHTHTHNPTMTLASGRNSPLGDYHPPAIILFRSMLLVEGEERKTGRVIERLSRFRSIFFAGYFVVVEYLILLLTDCWSS